MKNCDTIVQQLLKKLPEEYTPTITEQLEAFESWNRLQQEKMASTIVAFTKNAMENGNEQEKITALKFSIENQWLFSVNA